MSAASNSFSEESKHHQSSSAHSFSSTSGTTHQEANFSNIEKTYSTSDIRHVYKFVKVLGGGHFGTVRLAYLLSNPDKFFAVKSIMRSYVKPQEIHLLENELNILKSIDHPNIIRFSETFIDKKYVHIVQELCTGGELFDRIVESMKFGEK